ncbi:MAG: pentapeptide repeat-containing protein [Aestuariivita sp.]|nr:pentapeptide repeat-containing protein [Aestuariivita sp.]MCY4345546.1 pentapeptide repeat-containing protein [Aestuariivita sp.]
MANSDSILGLTPRSVKTIRFILSILGFFGLLAGLGGTVLTLQEQEKQQRIQISAAIANTAAQGIDEITSPFIHYGLHQMYEQEFPMRGITASGTLFLMAEFENVSWHDVRMDKVEFACNDQAYDRIDDWDEDDPKNPFCARLKGADFTGAYLRKARWDSADLRDAKFTSADLTEAQILDSVATNAKFLEGVQLRGITIKNSDFTKAKFSPEAKLNCTVMNEECALLQRSDFTSAVMNDVLFRGVEINRVDFSNAPMEKVEFDCERERNGKHPCTTLKEVCFASTNLARAVFENTKIENVDFTGADLKNARFKNVEFDDVVLSEEQEATAKFDPISLMSLRNARRNQLSSRNAGEVPCSLEWSRHIKAWKNRFGLDD